MTLRGLLLFLEKILSSGCFPAACRALRALAFSLLDITLFFAAADVLPIMGLCFQFVLKLQLQLAARVAPEARRWSLA